MLHGGHRWTQVRHCVHHFHLNPGMRIGRRGVQGVRHTGQTIGLIASEANGGRAVQRRWGRSELGQPSWSYLAKTLGHEQRLQQRLFVVRMLLDPSLQRFQARGSTPAQFEAGMFADQILPVGEQIQQGGEFGSLDSRPFGGQRARLVDDAPDAALHVVPTHVAHGVLGVTDDGAGEVGDVEGAVHAELHVDRAEGRILGRDQVQTAAAPHHALAEVEPCERHHVRSDAGGRGHSLLVFFREIQAGDARGGAALAVAHGLGIGEGMVNAQGGPGERQSVEDQSVAVHLEDVSGAVEGDLPRVRGDALPFRLDTTIAGIHSVGG